MDKADLEAKKNNLFDLLENVLKRKVSGRRLTVQCLIGHINEHSAMFGKEHWSIEHHGSDTSSLFYAAGTKEMALDGFREQIRSAASDVIYFVTKHSQPRENGTPVEKEIKIHVNKENGNFVARYKEIGNISLTRTPAENETDSFLLVAEELLDHLATLKQVKEVSLKAKNQNLGTLTVFKTPNNKYIGYLSNSEYKTEEADAYKSVDDLINKGVIPFVEKSGNHTAADITVENSK